MRLVDCILWYSQWIQRAVLQCVSACLWYVGVSLISTITSSQICTYLQSSQYSMESLCGMYLHLMVLYLFVCDVSCCDLINLRIVSQVCTSEIIIRINVNHTESIG